MMSITKVQNNLLGEQETAREYIGPAQGRICKKCGNTSIQVYEEDHPLTQERYRYLECSDPNCKGRDISRFCPECHNPEFYKDAVHGTVECTQCGLIVTGPPPRFVGGYHRVSYPWGALLDVHVEMK